MFPAGFGFLVLGLHSFSLLVVVLKLVRVGMHRNVG